MDERTYIEIAETYERLYGEPLYADAEWIGPFYEAAEVSVTGGGAYDVNQPDEMQRDLMERTATVIAVLTHGAHVKMLDQPTLRPGGAGTFIVVKGGRSVGLVRDSDGDWAAERPDGSFMAGGFPSPEEAARAL